MCVPSGTMRVVSGGKSARIDDRSGFAFASRDLAVDRQDQRDLRVARGSLGEEIEVAKLGHVIAPELETHRLGHSEAVDIEDSAAHTELRDVLHHWNALEADRLEVGREILGPARVALPKLEPRRGERARKLGALEKRAAGGDNDPEIASSDPFERLHSLAGDFGVRLGFTEALAGRVEGNRFGLHEGGQVRQPALGAGDVVVDDDEKSVGKVLGQGGDDYSVTGSMESSNTEAGRWGGYFYEELSELSERFHDGEQLWKRHGAR